MGEIWRRYVDSLRNIPGVADIKLEQSGYNLRFRLMLGVGIDKYTVSQHVIAIQRNHENVLGLSRRNPEIVLDWNTCDDA